MKMWIDYYSERLGGKVALTEGVGFIAYRMGGAECFIDDAYVAPGFRRKSEAAALLSEVEEDAKANGCTFIGAEVDLRLKSGHESLLASLGCGFSVEQGTGKVLLLRKELSNG